ncbi:hypothetical protein ANN_17629 [Periplaneta americana]|uniref:Uncharacterized protein n=1 Tax=Periplaneta americana TaxID=6978 RepID=A0ABQ8STG7_PERAM|nr:hypothetical protein ANN_17629 [Periplaneta americana]
MHFGQRKSFLEAASLRNRHLIAVEAQNRLIQVHKATVSEKEATRDRLSLKKISQRPKAYSRTLKGPSTFCADMNTGLRSSGTKCFSVMSLDSV